MLLGPRTIAEPGVAARGEAVRVRLWRRALQVRNEHFQRRPRVVTMFKLHQREVVERSRDRVNFYGLSEAGLSPR